MAWFQDNGCDVWTGIRATKEIDAFDIAYRNSRVRLYADGRAYVIMQKAWDDDLGYFDEELGFIAPTEKALIGKGYRIVSGKVEPPTRARVLRLISPMRDFVGWRPPEMHFKEYVLIGISDERVENQLFDLGDRRTRIGFCRKIIFDWGKGWSIWHFDHDTRRLTGLSSYHDIGCGDPASIAGASRAEAAAALIIDAIGASAPVQQNDQLVPDPSYP